jgi:hypothetical protein
LFHRVVVGNWLDVAYATIMNVWTTNSIDLRFKMYVVINARRSNLLLKNVATVLFYLELIFVPFVGYTIIMMKQNRIFIVRIVEYVVKVVQRIIFIVIYAVCVFYYRQKIVIDALRRYFIMIVVFVCKTYLIRANRLLYSHVFIQFIWNVAINGFNVVLVVLCVAKQCWNRKHYNNIIN